MAEVLLLCMRDDEEAAAILADLFYRAGFETAGGAARQDELDSCAVALVCWSGASQRSTQMREAADRAAQSGKAMIARLDGHPLPPSLWRLPAFDLSQWSFAPEDPVLDGLYAGVERAVTRARDAASRLGRIPPAHEPAPAPRGQTVSESDLEAEANFWRRIQSSTDPADFLSYLDRFGPKGAFAELALMRIERLGGTKPASTAPARAQPKPEPAPIAPAWTGWSVQPGAVRPPRFSDVGPDSIDDRLDRRQPESRRPADPPPRRPEPPRAEPPRTEPQRPDYYARDFDPEPPRARPDGRRPDPGRSDIGRGDMGRGDIGRGDMGRSEMQRPTPPRLDPVQPDARRSEPRRYITPQANEDAYRPAPPARRPRYDQDEASGGDPLPPSAKRRDDDSKQGGGRGILVALVAIAALAGAGFAMRGMLPKPTAEETAERSTTTASASPDDSLIGRPVKPPTAASAGTPDQGLTPPPRAEALTLDSVGVTETAPSSSITPRDRRLASNTARPGQRPSQAPAARDRWSPAPGAPDPNAAYAPPPSATLPSAEPPVAVQPAPVATVTPVPQPSPAAADAPVREAAKVRWQTRPTATWLDQLYPQRARQSDVEGQASLRCTILPDLRAACSLLSETPSGYGFGTAALRASESLRASPVLDDGSNATGAIADVSIRFKVQ